MAFVLNPSIFRLPEYRAELWYRARGDLRIDAIWATIRLISHHFACELFDSCDEKICTLLDLQRAVETSKLTNHRTGCLLTLLTHPATAKRRDTIQVNVRVGVDGSLSNTIADGIRFTVPFEVDRPPIDFLRPLVEFSRPFEAYVMEWQNADQVWDWTRRRQMAKGFDYPTLIHGWHYVSERPLAHLGGTKNCLSAPAFEALPLSEGILIKLCPEWFDSYSERDPSIQAQVMRYFGLL